ncbi:MAG: excinuclease ABC subunit UvrC [Syntrophales bacterium]
MSCELDVKIANAPRNPGVYLMKGGEGEILYVGKARDLRGRIRAYFSRTDGRAMIPFLLSRIRDIEFIITATEKEALILENNLIKEHRPRYNVDLRDDKAYFSIRIDPREPFARFHLVRRPKSDGARYFGPYPSSASAKETLRFLQTIFRIRSCRDPELRNRRRPCLEYEIGRCGAPCVGRIDCGAYRELVGEGIAFLEGRERALIDQLHTRMNAAAEELRFEEAAAIRDRIAAVEQTLERQRIVSLAGRSRDVFGLYREEDLTQVAALFIREGRVIGQKTFPLFRLPAANGEILSGLLKRYYDGGADIPDDIVVPEAPEDSAVIAEWLAERRGKAVAVVMPKRGEARALLASAVRNAEIAFRSARLVANQPEVALPQLAERLQLRRIPRRIECFDISNIGGKHAVGSLVAFTDGLPCKAGYRRFRIRTVPGADDYAMMYEVLKRRYEKRENLPDLVMVDGGKGQLGVALAALKDCGIDGVDVIGLAKERDGEEPTEPQRGETVYRLSADAGTGGEDGPGARRSGRDQPAGKETDRVYLPRRKDPVYLNRWPAALFLLQRVRDEAHRFAVAYHRRLKEKEDLRSLLDGIPGIGAARRKALLLFFGDVRRIRAASVDELRQVAGVGGEMAERIHRFFAGNSASAADAAPEGV